MNRLSLKPCFKLWKLMYKYEDEPRSTYLMDIQGCDSLKIFIDQAKRNGHIGFDKEQVENLENVIKKCEYCN